MLARFLKEASNDTATHSFKIKNFDDAFNAAMAYHGIYTKATDMDIIRLINKAKATQRARMTNTILRTVETSNDVFEFTEEDHLKQFIDFASSLLDQSDLVKDELAILGG